MNSVILIQESFWEANQESNILILKMIRESNQKSKKYANAHAQNMILIQNQFLIHENSACEAAFNDIWLESAS